MSRRGYKSHGGKKRRLLRERVASHQYGTFSVFPNETHDEKIVLCCWCKKEMKFQEATIEHIVPHSLGGGNQLKNLAMACLPCNGKRGNRTNQPKVGSFLRE